MSLKVGKDALEGLVQMDDLLMAMAESVMERQPKPFNPQLLFRDRKIEFKIGGRPPREVFYRKTTTFLTKLPPPVTKKLCTCKFLCTAGEQVPAVIKCHSCSIYDPSGASYYCQHCFNGRHPWYRVDHIYTKIDQDENIEYNLKVAHRLAEAARYEREGNDLLQSLQKEVVPKLEYVRNDEEIDDKMRIYGSHVTELEENIKALRQRLQDELQRGYVGKSYVTASQPPPKDLTSAADNEGLSLTTTDQNAISPPAQKEILKLITNEKRSRTTKLEQEPQHEKTNEKQHQPIKPLDSHGLKSLPSQISVMATEDYPETLDHKRSVLRASSHGDLELLHTGSNDALEEITRPASVDSSEAEHYKATNFDSNNSQMHALHGDSNNRQEESTESNKSSSILPSNTPKGHHRAAVNLQKLFKGYIGRKIVSSIMTTRIVRVFSTDYGRDFYYDRVTGLSAWTPHKLILPMHLDLLEYIVEASEKVIWTCKNTAAVIKQYQNRKVDIRFDQALAVKILQGFGRCIISRHRILRFANRRYRRVLDTEPGSDGQFYYANIRTGETSWTKPKIYCTSEPPVYQGDEELEAISDDDDNGVSKTKKGKKKKKKSNNVSRSPRLNRM